MFNVNIWSFYAGFLLFGKTKTMKKILEVLDYGNLDIRFNTDIDVSKTPEAITETIANTTWAMSTSLWGGNEQSVIAMIRALAIADLSLSFNRTEMIRYMDEASLNMAKTFQEAMDAVRRSGGKVMTFGPGIMPGTRKS